MYGLTEAFRSTYLDPAEVDRRPDSIGKAIPNAEIMVVREDGTPCAPGEEGELVHRGALVALGYWGDPERTAERFKPAPGREDGITTTEIAVWSGDAVVADEEGFLYFVGRKDDMIKTSGYRVSPTEIEEVVYSTGLVRDAVALGVDDDRLGQHIVLAVSPANGHELAARDAARRAAPAAAALHGPQARRRPRGAAALAQRQVRPQPAAPGAGRRHERRDRHHAPARGSSRRSAAIPLERLAAPRRVHAVLRLRPGADRPSASRSCAPSLPAGLDLSYAVKANPMPAVVAASQRARRLVRRRLGGRDARRARHADARVAGSASPARARRRPSCARRSPPA